MSEGDVKKCVKVFVLLGHGFGAKSWAQRHADGTIPGLNDRLAYGYYRAGGGGWSVEYSEDAHENTLITLFRLVLRRIVGCDLIHAWRNRKKLFAADIVWTHTEIENLAVLSLFWLCLRGRQPKVLANCVWLFDRWSHLSWPRRLIYRQLLKHADAVTTFSPSNIEIARSVLSGVRCEYIRWGATIEELKAPSRRPTHRPLRIASLGTDMHRDWTTIITAFGNRADYRVLIGSQRVDPKLLSGISNAKVVPVLSVNELKALYGWADVVVVSLKPNLHASGITVVLESVILGVPVVCTDCGGLRAYFSPTEVHYVPVYAPVAMRVAVEQLARDDDRRRRMVAEAQKRVFAANLTTEGFAKRHRLLSEELLAPGPRFGCSEGAVRGIG
jgi:glycosyltransferase involved in cell wall biosynthesis